VVFYPARVDRRPRGRDTSIATEGGKGSGKVLCGTVLPGNSVGQCLRAWGGRWHRDEGRASDLGLGWDWVEGGSSERAGSMATSEAGAWAMEATKEQSKWGYEALRDRALCTGRA